MILQGVYRRWLENPANGGPDVEALASRIDQLAELAELTTHQAGPRGAQ